MGEPLHILVFSKKTRKPIVAIKVAKGMTRSKANILIKKNTKPGFFARVVVRSTLKSVIRRYSKQSKSKAKAKRKASPKRKALSKKKAKTKRKASRRSSSPLRHFAFG